MGNKNLRPLIWAVSMFFVVILKADPTFALEYCPFRGQIDFLNKTIDLELGEKSKGSVSIQLAVTSEKIASGDNLSDFPSQPSFKYLGEVGTVIVSSNGFLRKQWPSSGKSYNFLEGEKSYKLKLNLENLKTSVFEVSTQLESSFELVESSNKQSRFLQGQVTSRYSLINRKPVKELAGNFKIKDHTLTISSGSLGGVNLNGFVELLNPYKMVFSVQLEDMPMSDFLSIWADNPDLRARGEVSGTIQILGPLKRFILKGSLFASQGEVEELSFNSITLNAEGEYPIIRLFDTTITQLDGISFNAEGDIDLSDGEHFRKQIEALTKSPLIQEGNSQWEWTIKRRDHKDVSVSELKYFLQKNSSQENPLKEGSELLGVEQKIKF